MAPSTHFTRWMDAVIMVALIGYLATPSWAQTRRQASRSNGADQQRQTRSSHPAPQRVITPRSTPAPRASAPPAARQRSSISNRSPGLNRNLSSSNQGIRSQQRTITQPRPMTSRQSRMRIPMIQPRNNTPTVRVPSPSISPRQRVERRVRVEPPASRRNPIINSNPDRSVVRLPSINPGPSDSRRSIIENRNLNNRSNRTPNPNRRQTVVVQPSPRPSTLSKDSLTRRNRIVQRSPLLIDPSRRFFPKTDPTRRLPVRRPAPVVSPQEVKQRLRSRTRPSEIRVDSSYRQIQRRIYPWRRREYPSLAYYDRPTISHTQHYIHTYQDRWHRWHQCIITPRFSIGLRYHWGHHYYLQHVYPFYHRKYVFVSLGGCWPLGSVALRYYWYGWYPYEWYGYNPVPYQLGGSSTNYYTYNYYDSDASLTSPLISDTQNQILDNGAPPEPQGPADVYFELAVKAFEQGDYRQAEDNLAQAMVQDSQDIVLPFAYAQTLFAQEQYAEAVKTGTATACIFLVGFIVKMRFYSTRSTVWLICPRLTLKIRTCNYC